VTFTVLGVGCGNFATPVERELQAVVEYALCTHAIIQHSVINREVMKLVKLIIDERISLVRHSISHLSSVQVYMPD